VPRFSFVGVLGFCSRYGIPCLGVSGVAPPVVSEREPKPGAVGKSEQLFLRAATVKGWARTAVLEALPPAAAPQDRRPEARCPM
jgi:hypothetical protein